MAAVNSVVTQDGSGTPTRAPEEIGSTPLEIVRAFGVTLVSADGTEYLDAESGTFNLPLGYSHPTVIEAVERELERLPYLSSTLTGPYVKRLADKLIAGAPNGIEHAWIRDATGSTANEAAIKMAQKATGRSDVISLFLSHHGQTLFTTAISGNAFRRTTFPNAVAANSVKVPAPYCFRCFYNQRLESCGLLCATRIDDFVDYASSGSVAALIVEPVLGNGGNVVPPPGYFTAIREVCDKHDIALIVDEVQTGLGRTGHLYACETFGITPDIITLAKGLGGVGLPLGAVLSTSRFAVLDKNEHSFTSGGNHLALAAAGATLDVITADGFLAGVRARAVELERRLTSLAERHPIVVDLRGVGLMWGLEVADAEGRPAPEAVTRLIDVAREKYHLILRGSRYGRGNVVKVRPALTATTEEIDEMIYRLDNALLETAAAL